MTFLLYDDMETEIVCPECGQVKLRVKHNGPGKLPFLDCPRWPDCWHTDDLPASLKPYEIVPAPVAA